MEQAVGEDVTALAVGSELNLVDGDEVRLEIERHRLDGAHVIFRLRRLDLLFAGDERDLVGADARDDLVVDLARKQPQRQADDADVMRKQPLDGEMGLAGIGRPENRGHAAPAHQS